MEETAIKLTQFSKGSGCGCKIAPADLQEILQNSGFQEEFKSLLVGSSTNDDAAVIQINETQAIISTTDFFTPIVDDAYTFGKIAAANALSDAFAMGGKVISAIAILGWPVERLPKNLAGETVRGARELCAELGVPLAGGHSIDAPEPFFGLAVTGIVEIAHIKQNSKAKASDLIYLTKPIGTGVLSTAVKRGLASESESNEAIEWMTKVNGIGEQIGLIAGVNALTDVTGFGLLGHLIEMAAGSGQSAEINYEAVPKLEAALKYAKQFVMPDNTMRNFKAYNEKVNKLSAEQLQMLCDPQTNGGLLIAVDPKAEPELLNLLNREKTKAWKIGQFLSQQETLINVI